jgi:predicted DNA-binding transcriptional regulator YafY
MANYGNSKIKILLLHELLNRYSDEEHPLSSGELCELLQERGITGERKSIYRDISVLMDYGVDIIGTHSPKPGFFVAEREFELPEVRLLLDAVLTAPFITTKKTSELTDKLKGLLSCYQADDVWKQIYVDQRIKFENEEIYYNIDAINRAIANNKKISFQYHHKVILNQKAEFDEGREFIISPYALLWANDKYYLAGNYEKYDNVSNYRLDRIKHAVVLDSECRPFSEVSSYLEHFDSADYLRKTFNMYNGKPEQIELRCSNNILETIADKFGSDIEYCCHDENAFTVRANVYVSDGLIEWLLQYGNRIVVQSPQKLKKEMIQRIEELNAAYEVN